MLTVFCQFAVHFYSLYFLTKQAKRWSPGRSVEYEVPLLVRCDSTLQKDMNFHLPFVLLTSEEFRVFNDLQTHTGIAGEVMSY